MMLANVGRWSFQELFRSYLKSSTIIRKYLVGKLKLKVVVNVFGIVRQSIG